MGSILVTMLHPLLFLLFSPLSGKGRIVTEIQMWQRVFCFPLRRAASLRKFRTGFFFSCSFEDIFSSFIGHDRQLDSLHTVMTLSHWEWKNAVLGSLVVAAQTQTLFVFLPRVYSKGPTQSASKRPQHVCFSRLSWHARTNTPVLPIFCKNTGHFDNSRWNKNKLWSSDTWGWMVTPGCKFEEKMHEK